MRQAGGRAGLHGGRDTAGRRGLEVGASRGLLKRNSALEGAALSLGNRGINRGGRANFLVQTGVGEDRISGCTIYRGQPGLGEG